MLAAEHRLFLVTSRARTHARVHAGIKGAKGAPGVQQVYFKASTSTNSDKNWSTYEKRNGWLSGQSLLPCSPKLASHSAKASSVARVIIPRHPPDPAPDTVNRQIL